MAQSDGQRAWGRKIRILIIAAGISIVGVGTLYATGRHTAHSTKTLIPTSNAPNAHGTASYEPRCVTTILPRAASGTT